MSILKRVIIYCFFGFLFSNSVFAQNPLDISFELQAYPTGLQPGLQISKGFKDKNAMHLRVGYNWVRHGDAGVHEDERGGGFGFTFGYRRFLKSDFQGLFMGVRNDFWFNTLDWADHIDKPEEEKGTAEIIVVQPTAQLGYLWNFGANWIFSPTISWGYEINLGEDEGEDVGEGMIMLLGIELGKRF